MTSDGLNINLVIFMLAFGGLILASAWRIKVAYRAISTNDSSRRSRAALIFIFLSNIAFIFVIVVLMASFLSKMHW